MLDTGGAHRSYATARGDGLAPAPAWELVTVPSRQGLEAVDILRLRTGVGPVLHDASGDTLGFLVPTGTAADWDLPGSACTQTHGRGRDEVGEPPVAGTRWLVAPEHGIPVNDPTLLRLALGEAARTIEAADGIQAVDGR
ncbi:hypothetical protein ACFOSC_16795 [Streptantibioticus rubrisoli]|uniref:hypothetical protein n=1 Tax=Streptantibioticus rubrisoli TaxID=1387313 RepID=UPI003557A037